MYLGMGDATTIGFDVANALSFVRQPTAKDLAPNTIPWYCGGPSFLTDRLESCIPSAVQQAEIMRGNFGGHSDPARVDQAVKDFAGDLETSGYDATVEKLKQEDRDAADPFKSSGVPWYLWLAGGLGVFALVAVSAGSPRRYGR